jgi:hypothetical protein
MSLVSFVSFRTAVRLGRMTGGGAACGVTFGTGSASVGSLTRGVLSGRGGG